jgi:hypothetical protein
LTRDRRRAIPRWNRTGARDEVPLRQRNALLLAAGYAPAYAETRLDDPGLEAVRGALERILEGHLPYPAVISDHAGGLVSGNRAFWALAEGAAPALLAAPVSLPRLLLHPDGMAPRILNLDAWGWHVVAALRREAQRGPSARLEELIAELEALLPERPRVAAPTYLGLAVPLRLRARRGDSELHLLTTLTHFGTAVDVALAELRLEAFLPADASTAAALAAL